MGKGIINDAQAMALGLCPHATVKDTDAHTGLNAFLIKVREAAVFTSLTDALEEGSVATVTYAAGEEINGKISAFTLASGAVTYYEWPTPATT